MFRPFLIDIDQVRAGVETGMHWLLEGADA
jgi:hypothetical protein